MSDQESLWNQHFPCFSSRNDEAVERLKATTRLVRLSEGQSVFHPGSPCTNYLLLVEGEVRVQTTTQGGREILLYRVLPGNACILTTSCLLGRNGYPAEGIAAVQSMALAVPEEEFRQALNQSEFFRDFVFKDFSKRLARVIARMEELMTGNIDSRLANTLLAAAREGFVRKTHQELAMETGTAREVVSRHLLHYQRNGWVKLGRRSIEIVNLTALERLVAQSLES